MNRHNQNGIAASQRSGVLGDALIRDVSYAFRTFGGAPLATATIVATIALGLGLIAAVFTLFSAVFLRVDAVRNPNELFRVTRSVRPGADSLLPFTRAEYESLRRETIVFGDIFAVVGSIETRTDGRPISSKFVTGNFFQALGVHAALGRTLTVAEDESSGGRPIVLSHRGWKKLYGDDPSPVGRSIAINGLACEVVGVMPEDFRGLSLGPPDFLGPLELAAEFRPTYAGREMEMPFTEVVGRLKKQVSPEQAAASLKVWASQHDTSKLANDRPGAIMLKPQNGTLPVEFLAVFAPIFFAFGLILMIGCANVANLLLARAVSRQREIGVRLSLGASRWRLIQQLLTESLILAIVSAGCGFFVSRICLEGAVYAITATMPAEIGEQVQLVAPSADWRLALFLAAGAIVSTAFFGLAPALQATRVELTRAIRGEVTRDPRPSKARHSLVAFQVGASALLLICAVVFLRSALAAQMADPGLRTADTIMVPIANEPRRAAIIRELAAHPLVIEMAASTSGEHAQASASAEAAQENGNPKAIRSTPIVYKLVSPEYFQLLEIRLVQGRGFTKAERTADAAVAVVSEQTAHQLWPDGAAIGRILSIQQVDSSDQKRSAAAPTPFQTYTVIGIAKDVEGDTLFPSFSFSGVYLPTHPQAAGTSLILRVHGDPANARLALLDRLTRIDPALDHEVKTMRTVVGIGAYILKISFWITMVLGGLALALTVSGLFGVLSYLVEQRAKEIGIRLALGATTRDIAALVLTQSVRPVGLGLLAGSGLAAAVATLLISTPFASEIGNTVHVLDPIAYATSLVVIVAATILAGSIPALRAARLDPVVTLRQD